ncbi:hypothetical protein GCM10009868_31220 [Terrabacter aerolatus]|uniref:Uncharacterized protein n=1 Tax=Terrabacter aerolatus TaxID=422442 RepID=A0A512CYZ1_9MICO|nr:hypothetical protein [Terrabacter aerolatus]GEO29435.1 hypothetical protein TAE01_12450 [Terrabacter aerolatus]
MLIWVGATVIALGLAGVIVGARRSASGRDPGQRGVFGMQAGGIAIGFGALVVLLGIMLAKIGG